MPAPNPATTNWVPLGGGSAGLPIPQPVVNGQWIKGVGGVPVWSAIAEADLPAYSPSKISGYPSDQSKFLRGDGLWAGPVGAMTAAGFSTTAFVSAGGYSHMGLGAAGWRLTTVLSGRVLLIATGNCDCAGVNAGFMIYYGVGTAPANGAAATGNQATLPLTSAKNQAVALAVGLPLGVGTNFWFDVVVTPDIAGNICRITNPTLTAAEL